VPKSPALSIETTTSGAILTATALTETTGYWQAGLVRIEAPRTAPPPTSSAPPRRPPGAVSRAPNPRAVIVAAADARSRRPAGLRSITVIARTNRRTVERR
jgi:hypothetical protein